jgi:hypothetical protein
LLSARTSRAEKEDWDDTLATLGRRLASVETATHHQSTLIVDSPEIPLLRRKIPLFRAEFSAVRPGSGIDCQVIESISFLAARWALFGAERGIFAAFSLQARNFGPAGAAISDHARLFMLVRRPHPDCAGALEYA